MYDFFKINVINFLLGLSSCHMKCSTHFCVRIDFCRYYLNSKKPVYYSTTNKARKTILPLADRALKDFMYSIES